MAGNPYEAPQSRVADVAVETEEFQPIRMWSAKGRMGRLRYLAYTGGASLVFGVFVGIALAALGPDAMAIVTLLGYAVLIVFGILIGIQRAHDMNWTGWTVLLMMIPLVGLIWIFKAGSAGANDYGGPPPPNTVGVKVFAFVFPIIAIVGVLAAIALPAYQDYVQRVEAQQ